MKRFFHIVSENARIDADQNPNAKFLGYLLSLKTADGTDVCPPIQSSSNEIEIPEGVQPGDYVVTCETLIEGADPIPPFSGPITITPDTIIIPVAIGVSVVTKATEPGTA